MATISRLSVSLTATTKGFQRGLKKAQTSFGRFKSSVLSTQGLIIGGLATLGVGHIIGDLVSVNEEFQRLKSALKTITGSQGAADAAFGRIEKFALRTPFALKEVVDSFIKLKALGLDPSERALNSYGNTASAMGKSLNQMIEAVADASTGEFERLKEFGIKAKSQGDEVSFTFQGITTTVKKNAAEIEGFLLGIGENQFGSAMKDQMGNLTPAFSNLEASVNKLQVAVGEAGLNELITDATTSMTAFISSIDPESVVSGFAQIKEAIQSVNDLTGGVTDVIGEAAAQNQLENLMTGGITSGDFVNGLTDSAKIAFAKATEEGGFFSDNLPGANEPTFEEFARRIRGEDNPQLETTNELLGTLVKQNKDTVVAVAG